MVKREKVPIRVRTCVDLSGSSLFIKIPFLVASLLINRLL